MRVEKQGQDSKSADAAVPARGDDAPPARRDLVVVNPPVTERTVRSRLTDALFVAHLFATRYGAAQTREKRRAEPGDANASYRRAAKPAARTGGLVSKKI